MMLYALQSSILFFSILELYVDLQKLILVQAIYIFAMHIYLEKIAKYHLYRFLFTSVKIIKFHINKHYTYSENLKEHKMWIFT